MDNFLVVVVNKNYLLVVKRNILIKFFNNEVFIMWEKGFIIC